MIGSENECRLVNVETTLKDDSSSDGTGQKHVVETCTPQHEKDGNSSITRKASWRRRRRRRYSSRGPHGSSAQGERTANPDTPPLPAIEIQFENFETSNSFPIQGAPANSGEMEAIPSTVFVTPHAAAAAAAGCRGNRGGVLAVDVIQSTTNHAPPSSALPKNPNTEADETNQATLPHSTFSFSDLFGGGTTGSAAPSTGTPTSFFPDSWVLNQPATPYNNDNAAGSQQPDEGSVMSTAYFDQSDFSPRNWNMILTEQEVVLGLAVVYLTISLTHPLLFLAGALTALSTATAVGAGYDFLVEGPLTKCLCGHSLAAATTSPESAKRPTDKRDSTSPAPGKASPATASDHVLSSQADSTRSVVATPNHRVGKAETTALLEGTCNASSVTSTTSSTSVTTFNKPTEDEEEEQGNILTTASVVLASTSTMNTMSTVDGFRLPDDWIPTHYPPLNHAVVDRHEFFGLNVNQFFQVFLANNAPYSYKEFQNKRGDKNIEYGSWQDIGNTVDKETLTPLSMHPNAQIPFPHELEYNDYYMRTLCFQAKTNNSFIGPPYASTTKEQRILIVNKKLGILEMKTTLADIPFCDRFFVMERWILTAGKGLMDGNYRCQLSTSCEVFFVKSCPFESQIRTKTKSSIQDVSTAWVHMANKALALSEQHKQKRIRQEQDLMIEEDDDDADVGNGAGTEDKENVAGQDNLNCQNKGSSNAFSAVTIAESTTPTSNAFLPTAPDDFEAHCIEVTESDMQKSLALVEQSSNVDPQESRSILDEAGSRRKGPLSRFGRFLSHQRRKGVVEGDK